MSDDDSRDSRDKKVNGDVCDKDSICRDYLRNVCRRGKRCKYRHPEASEAEELGRKIEYIFCHDYQNKECRRGNCKFIHCTREEEEYYRTTGDLPQHVLDAVVMSKGIHQETTGPRGEVPVCKDYLKGDCRRAGRCKFRHVNSSDYDVELSHVRRRERFDHFDHFDGFDHYDPVPKRRHIEDFSCSPSNLGMITMGMRQSLPPPPDYALIDGENALLRRKVEELKKQVADLTATNEFLLDQNAQLRLGKQTTIPTVTQALNPNTMQTPTPVPMTMSNDLAGGPPPNPLQTQLAAAAAAAAPLGTPMAPVNVSLAQAIPVSLPQSIAMSMTAPSTTLVSYPIMTQSMRPNLPQSTLPH